MAEKGKDLYFYGVTGGNVYLDNNTKDLLNEAAKSIDLHALQGQLETRREELLQQFFEENGRNPNNVEEDDLLKADEAYQAMVNKNTILGLASQIKPEVSQVMNSVIRVNTKTENGSGRIPLSGDTGLNLKGYKDKDWVRYYGAIGGDTAINTGLTGHVKVSADVSVSLGNVNIINDTNIINIDKTYPETDKDATVIYRDGDVTNYVGSDAGSASVIGGVGGSTALAVGNLTADMENAKGANKTISVPVLGGSVTAQIHANVNVQDVKLQGEAATTINGDVKTIVDEDANVVGWMNGGLAGGIGGIANSTVTGSTTITIDGADRKTIGTEDDKTDALSQVLNMMKGSGVNAVGVIGAGTAVSTLGGTATAEVDNTSTINVDDATVIGMIGGGAAASVDATGLVETVISGQRGNDDHTMDVDGAQLDELLKENGILGKDGALGGILGDTGLIPDDLTITATDAIDGGTATSTTGDTTLNITGNSTVIGAVGGGLAAASHTYTYKVDGTYKGEVSANLNDAWGKSEATATTGRSHITVNLPNSAMADENGNAWEEVSGAVGDLISGLTKKDEDNNSAPEIASNALSRLDNKGGAFGIFGGGVAVGHGSLRATLSEGNGATAIANTAGSDIDLVNGYAAAVFGGGAAVTENLARAEANMTDDVNITTYSDMTTVGLFGGGLALSMEGKVGVDNYRAKANETLAKSNVDTVNITNYGDTDGIFGGGMAIGNSCRNEENKDYNDAVSSVQTSNITVNGGTVNNLNMEAFMGALKNGNKDGEKYPQWSVLGVNASGAMVDLKGIMDNTSIAAGGLGMGMTGEARVDEANVTINGGTVTKDILGGGIGIDNYGEKGGAHVGESNITLNDGEVDGSVYAGGGVNGSTPGQVDKAYNSIGYDASQTSSTVNNATVTLNGTSVTGEISGQGYSKITQYTVKSDGKDFDPYNTGSKVTYSDKKLYDSVTGTSTLNLIGNNTLTMLGTAGEGDNYTSEYKVHDFDELNAVSGSVTALTGLTANADGNPGSEGTAVFGNSEGVTTKVNIAADAYLDISNIGGEETEYNGQTYHVGENLGDLWSKDAMIYDRTQYYATTATDDSGSYDITVSKLDENNKAVAAESFGNLIEAGPLQPTVDDLFDKGWDDPTLTEGGKQFFKDWSNNPTMHEAYGRGAMIGEDAAVTGNTVSIARDMADNVMQRLSFTDDYVQDNGWVNNDGGIWAKYIHRKYETDNMGSSFGGIHSSTDYDGAIVGVDFAKHGNFQSGVAFHYGSGDGNGLISRNDYDAWGFTLYGSLKDEEAGTNLMADVGYVTSDNDIDGTVAGKSLSADRDVDAWTIGLRGEKEYVFGQNQLVPYVGLRYMSVNPARYSVYYDGAKAFNADADNQNLWLLPIGVSFRNETVTDGGWRITPKLDLSYIWAFGDTDTDMTLDMGGVGSGLYYDVMDDNSWLASLGVEATKDVWSFGVGYGYQKGDDTKNKTWFVNASYAF